VGAARGLLAAIALLALAFVADLVVEEVIRWGAANFRSAEALAVVTVVRVGLAALIVGLAWLVFAGPRSRLAGLVMALAGGYVALIPVVLWLSFDQVSRLPFAFVHSLGISAFAWTGAVVAVLGVIELARPTAGGAASGAPGADEPGDSPGADAAS
jgi:hypothetical protein